VTLVWIFIRCGAAELEPTITSARQKTVETWARLPGPVQQALPFIAVGATVAFGVKLMSDRALFQEVAPSPSLSPLLFNATQFCDDARLDARYCCGRRK
jgi:hypothetical protein